MVITSDIIVSRWPQIKASYVYQMNNKYHQWLSTEETHIAVDFQTQYSQRRRLVVAAALSVCRKNDQLLCSSLFAKAPFFTDNSAVKYILFTDNRVKYNLK